MGSCSMNIPNLDDVLTGIENRDVPYVRTLIVDDNPEARLFEDHQLAELVLRNGMVPELGAAAALDVIASSEALLSKKITTQDLSTDGPAVAASLRAHAKALRGQVAEKAEQDEAWGLVVFGEGPEQAPEGTERRW